MTNKKIQAKIEQRRRGKGVAISAVFPENVFKKFYADAEKQGRSESNLLTWIVSEHYKKYGEK
jgi:hypothetical protein